jgi:N-acyl-D-aspartate/D-glutamate deacylase
VLTLEEAIRKMTSWPASRLRLDHRGSIKEDQWADVVVFDYDKVRDLSTYDHPIEFAEGIDYVLVNGTVVIDRGKHTGAKPGKVIYGAGRVGN